MDHQRLVLRYPRSLSSKVLAGSRLQCDSCLRKRQRESHPSQNDANLGNHSLLQITGLSEDAGLPALSCAGLHGDRVGLQKLHVAVLGLRPLLVQRTGTFPIAFGLT